MITFRWSGFVTVSDSHGLALVLERGCDPVPHINMPLTALVFILCFLWIPNTKSTIIRKKAT